MDASILTNQVVVSSIIVGLLQWLKKAPWFPLLSKETQNLNRVIAILLSFLAALGVHTTFANGVLTVTGLTTMGILTAGYNWIFSFVTQQGLFKLLVSPPPTQTLVNQTVLQPIDITTVKPPNSN
jgi:hypothetical protein